MVSKELIVLITDCGQGYVIKRQTKEKFENDNIEELAKILYAAAPEEHVCAVYACCSPNYQVMQHVINALHDVGYTDIKTVNQTALKFGQLAEASNLKLRTKDFVAFDTTNRFSYCVYQRSSSGFTFIGDSEQIQSAVVVLSNELKKVIVANGNQLSDADRKAYSLFFYSDGMVYFNCDDESFAIDDIWRLYEQKSYKFSVPFVMHIRLSYGNMIHLVDIKNDELPVNKVFEIDTENSNKIEVAVAYNNSSFYQCKHITFEHDDSKNRKVEVTVYVPQTFLPTVMAKVVSEADKPDYSVYSIDYNYESKKFTGTHITAESTNEIVSGCTDETEVISALAAHKSSTELRGILINYSEAPMFPLDVHRKLISALQLFPSQNVIVGPVHTYFSIHLKNAKVDVECGDLVAMIDYTIYRMNAASYVPKFYFFEKTDDGFEPLGQGTVLRPECKVLVIIDNEHDSWVVEKHERDYGSANLKTIFSLLSKLPENILHKFAWDYFNGKNFDGYMIRSYQGVDVSVHSNDLLTVNKWTDSYGYASQRCALIDIERNFRLDARDFFKPNNFNLAYFTMHPTVFFHYIGFRRPLAVSMELKSFVAVLNVCIGKNLLPSLEMKESKSIQNLIQPLKVKPLLSPFTIDPSQIHVIIVIQDGGDKQYTTSLVNGKLMFSTFDDITSVANAIQQVADMTYILTVYDLSSETDISKRRFRRKLLSGSFPYQYQYVSERKLTISTMLTQWNTKIALDESVVIFSASEGHLFLKKRQNEFKPVYFTEDNDIQPLFSNYNVKLVIFDKLTYTDVRIYKKKFAPVKCVENLEGFDVRLPVPIKPLYEYVNGKGLVPIADYDILTYSLTINGGEKQIIHNGVVSLRFDKFFFVQMDGVTSISIDVTSRQYAENLLTCDTKDCKDKYYAFHIMQSDHTVINAFEVGCYETPHIFKDQIFSKDGIVKPKAMETVKREKICALLLSFMENHQITAFIATGDFDGVTNVDPVPAYFYLLKTEDGGLKTQVGAEARDVLDTDKKFVIYDFPKLLVADTDPNEEDPTWTFETSRADDGSLLVHLSDGDVTSPLTLFASVVKSFALYAKQFSKHDINAILLRLPGKNLISEDNLLRISIALEVEISLFKNFYVQ